MKTSSAYTHGPLLAHVCAVGVAGYFLYAACGKIIDPRQFAIDIHNYQMMPTSILNLMALFMPWWEVGAAIIMLAPRTRRAGAIMISALLLIFIIAVAYAALYKGLDITCGCTGEHSSRAGWMTILRNVGLLVLTAASLYLPAWLRRFSPAGTDEAQPPDSRRLDLSAEPCAER